MYKIINHYGLLKKHHIYYKLSKCEDVPLFISFLIHNSHAPLFNGLATTKEWEIDAKEKKKEWEIVGTVNKNVKSKTILKTGQKKPS